MRRLAVALLAAVPLLAAAPAYAGWGGDVSASASLTRSPVGGGGPTTLVFDVADNGPGGATGLILDFTAPDGIAVTEAPGCAISYRYVHCELGDYAEGQVGQVKVGLRGDVKGQYDLQGTLYTSTWDPNRENDTTHAQLEVKSTAKQAPGTGGSTGSGGSGDSGDEPDSEVLGSSRSSLRVRARGTQRILKTGGIAVLVTPGADGPLDVRATVRVPGHGPLKLASVWRRSGTPGRTERIWLGTTPAMKRVLRAGFRRAGEMRATVRIRYESRTRVRVLRVVR